MPWLPHLNWLPVKKKQSCGLQPWDQSSASLCGSVLIILHSPKGWSASHMVREGTNGSGGPCYPSGSHDTRQEMVSADTCQSLAFLLKDAELTQLSLLKLFKGRLSCHMSSPCGTGEGIWAVFGRGGGTANITAQTQRMERGERSVSPPAAPERLGKNCLLATWNHYALYVLTRCPIRPGDVTSCQPMAWDGDRKRTRTERGCLREEKRK